MRSGIEAQMALYFDGLYHGDVARLRQVFHPLARYVCATDPEDLVHLDMPGYFALVAAREAPAARAEIRRDEIVSITFAGSRTALVQARCTIGPRYFTDFLSFIATVDGWRIIAKVFHYDITRP